MKIRKRRPIVFLGPIKIPQGVFHEFLLSFVLFKNGVFTAFR